MKQFVTANKTLFRPQNFVFGHFPHSTRLAASFSFCGNPCKQWSSSLSSLNRVNIGISCSTNTWGKRFYQSNTSHFLDIGHVVFLNFPHFLICVKYGPDCIIHVITITNIITNGILSIIRPVRRPLPRLLFHHLV